MSPASYRAAPPRVVGSARVAHQPLSRKIRLPRAPPDPRRRPHARIMGVGPWLEIHSWPDVHGQHDKITVDRHRDTPRDTPRIRDTVTLNHPRSWLNRCSWRSTNPDSSMIAWMEIRFGVGQRDGDGVGEAGVADDALAWAALNSFIAVCSSARAVP